MSDIPAKLTLHKRSRRLDVRYADGTVYELPAEYLRVHSPSAEVKGHGPGQEQLVWGKRHVAVTRIDPVGSYAVRLVFDDGHDTGLYSWPLLRDLGEHFVDKWEAYEKRLADADLSRDPGVRSLESVVKTHKPRPTPGPLQ